MLQHVGLKKKKLSSDQAFKGSEEKISNTQKQNKIRDKIYIMGIPEQ